MLLKYQPPASTLTLPVSLPSTSFVLLSIYWPNPVLFYLFILFVTFPLRERFLSFIFTAIPKTVPGIELDAH